MNTSIWRSYLWHEASIKMEHGGRGMPSLWPAASFWQQRHAPSVHHATPCEAMQRHSPVHHALCNAMHHQSTMHHATPCTISPPSTMHHQSTIHHKPCTTSQPGTRWVQKIKTKWQNHLELFGKTKVHFSSFVLPCHVGHYQISYQWQLSSKRGCHTFLISHQSTSCGTIVRASASNCDGQ